MKNKSFVVFLDVDGVLNTNTTCQRTPEGYHGVDDARVKILANAIAKMGGGDIVLTSDWKELQPTNDDYLYLCSALSKYGLNISAHTEDEKHRYRGAGIKAYLEKHPEIEEYVILDDHKFDFDDYTDLWERLLLTTPEGINQRARGIEFAESASQTPMVEAMLFLQYIKESS